MSYKDFSKAQDAPGKVRPVDKSGAVPAANPPAKQSDMKPAQAAPTHKS